MLIYTTEKRDQPRIQVERLEEWNVLSSLLFPRLSTLVAHIAWKAIRKMARTPVTP